MFGKKVRRAAVGIGTSALVAGTVLAGGGIGAAGAASKLSGPVKLAFLWQIKGESSYAIQTYQSAATMAVSQLNKAGGISGHKITYSRYPATPVTASQATSQYIAAASAKPAAMIGPPGPIMQVLVRYENQYKIPMFSASTTETSEVGKKFGTVWRFTTYTSPQATGSAEVKYIVQDLHVKKIGIIGSPDSADAGITGSAKAEIKALGATVVATRTIAVTATDATGQVLAMKGAGAIILATYPNPMGVVANQIGQDGVTTPLVTDTRMFQPITSGVVKKAATAHLFAFSGCPLLGSSVSSTAKQFLKNYKSLYGITATPQAGETFDEVNVIAKAIKKAGTTTSTAVKKVLSTQSFTGNVCAPTYKANASHTMSNAGVIYSFANPTAPKSVYTYKP